MATRVFSIRLAEELVVELDARAERLGVRRNAVIRQALEEASGRGPGFSSSSSEVNAAVVGKEKFEKPPVEPLVQKNAYHCPVEGCQEWSRNPKSECLRHKVGLV